MPYFTFKGRNNRGELITGTLEGGDAGVIADQLMNTGITPVDIQASRAAGVRAVAVLGGAGDSATLSAHWPDRLLSSHARLAEIVEPA